MKVKLLRDVRPFGMTGETVEVSTDHSEYLLSLGMAVPVEEVRERTTEPEEPAEAAEMKNPEAEETAKMQNPEAEETAKLQETTAAKAAATKKTQKRK